MRTKKDNAKPQNIDHQSFVSHKPFFTHAQDVSNTRFFNTASSEVQKKPVIGKVDDPLEKEADEVADKIVAQETIAQEVMTQQTIAPQVQPLSTTALTGTDSSAAKPSKPAPVVIHRQQDDKEEQEQFIQAKGEAREKTATPAEQAAQAVSSGGRALSTDERSFYEPAMGQDFSAVRIHEGSEAGAAAGAIHAKAYTLGNNIAFAPGQYNKADNSSRHLMAHELTHVIQQAGVVATPTIRRDPDLLSLRNLRPQLDEGCTPVYQQYVSDEPGPESSYPGRFRTLEVAYCINFPAPSVEMPIGLSRGTVSFYRFAEIVLDSGMEVHFLLHASQALPDDWRPAGAEPTVAELVTLLETAAPAIFNLEIDVPSGGGGDNLLIVGSSSVSSPNSMHGLLRDLASEWASVDITADQQYLNILGRLFTHLPYLNRFTVDMMQPPPNHTFDSLAAAEAYAHSAMAHGTFITHDTDGYHVYLLSPMDFFWLSEEIRHGYGRNFGNNPRYQFFTQAFIKFFHYGNAITELSSFRHRYYLHPDDATHTLRGDAIIYKTDDGFYGRYTLRHQDAQAYWRRFDAMDTQTLDQFRIRHWQTHEDLGRFETLSVKGLASRHSVDRDYYHGRDLFAEQAGRANDGRAGVNGVAPISFNWLMNDMPGHEAVRRYIRGELDRETDGNSNQLLGVIDDRDTLASHVGSIAIEEVTNTAQPIAINMISGMVELIDSLGGSEDQIKRLLISYPSLAPDVQRQIVAALGIEESDQDSVQQTLTDASSMLDIYRGLEVNGVSIARITRSVQQTQVQLREILAQLRSWQIKALMIDGEFGDVVRQETYDRLGFVHLRGNTFPHNEETEGIIPGALSGDASNYRNLLEQMYANELNAQVTTERILIVTAVVVITAILILISMGVGAYIAGAVGVAGTFWETVITAGVLTLMQEGLAQALGGGALNSEEDDFGLQELGGNFVLNVVMFRLFGGLGRALRGSSALLRLPVTFGAFFAFNYGAHLATHQGEFPDWSETGFILYESALMFLLLEVGGSFARTTIKQLRVSGSSARVSLLNSRLQTLQAEANVLRALYNEQYTSDTPSTEAKIDLARRYLNLMTRQQTVLENIRDTAGVETDINIESELQILRNHIRSVKEARTLLITRLQPIEGGDGIYSYDPTARSVAAIREQYGADNVSGPDHNGIIRINFHGRQLLLYPIRTATGESVLQTAMTARPGTRIVTNGVIAAEPRVLSEIRSQITEQGGEVNETAEGSLAISLNGESLIIVSEGALRLVPRALTMEAQAAGTGITYLSISLRSSAARRGLRHLLDTRFDGRSAARQLRDLQALEAEAQRNNRSINDVLEEIGLERITQETGEAIAELDLERGEHITRTDAHLQALQRQLVFLEALETAGNDVATALTAVRAGIVATNAVRAQLLVRQGDVIGLQQHFSYDPTPEAVDILRSRYGADQVTGPDADGIVVVDNAGVQLTFLPVRDSAVQGQLYQVLSGRVGSRVIDTGIIAVEARVLRGIEAQVRGQGGSWQARANGVHLARSGTGETVIVITEGSLRIAATAIAAETQTPGTGIDLLRSQLANNAARRGLRHQLETVWRAETDMRKLELLRDMETAGDSLNSALKAIGDPILISEARAEFVRYLQDNQFFNDPWLRARVADGNWGEVRGRLGERLAEMEINRDLAQMSAASGRTLRLVSGAKVVRRLAYRSKAEWVADNQPQQADFASEAEFHAAQQHFRNVSNGVHELPSERSVWQEVNEIDHMTLDAATSGELTILQIIEVKAGATTGAEAQVTAKRLSVTQVLETGEVTSSSGDTSEGRIYLYQNNTLDTNLTPDLRLPASEISTEVRTPSSGGSRLGSPEIRNLAREIVNHPDRFVVP